MRAWPILLLVVIGCGDDRASQAPPADGGGPPDASQKPSESCTPATQEWVSFGGVPGGGERIETIEGCTSPSMIDAPDGGFVVIERTRMSVTVRFRPQRAGLHAATLTLGEQTIRLAGTGRSPRIGFEPEQLDLDDVRVDCRGEPTLLHATNDEDHAVTVAELELEGDAESFEVVSPLPLTIPAKGRAEVRIQFNPTAAIDRSARLRFVVREFAERGPASSRMQGHGVIETAEDIFDTPPLGKVDVLFVVGASRNGVDRHAVRENIIAHQQFQTAAGNDARIAVTDAAVQTGLGGRFAGRGIIPVGTPNTERDLLEAFDVAMVAASDVMPLEAMIRALTPPLTDGPNVDFPRPGSTLTIIFIVDREDRSVGSVDDYLDALRVLEPQLGTAFVGIGTIAGESPGGCDGPGGHAESAHRLIAFAEDRGGIFQSICTADWSRSLKPPGETFVRRRRLPLSASPIAETIRVFFDDVERLDTSAGGTVNWAYDAAFDAVVFSPFSHPEPGTRVRITYDEVCPPLLR